MREAKTSVKSMLFARKGGLGALLLAALASLVYLLTLAPDVLPGDPGEFQFAAWRLGLAHPTGYPLYLILGSAWQHAAALVGVPPAASLNALSALFAVLTVLVMAQLMEGAPLAGAVLRRTVALWTGLMLAVNLTFWSQALVAEVYTLHALLLVLLLWALQAAIPPIGPRRLRPRRRSRLAPRRLMLIALILGLSFAHHAMTLLAIPAVLLYLWTIDPRWHRLPWATWGKILAALLTPLLLYAYIPLRSGPQASPWLHQRLGDGTLTLYHNDWASFLNFITGRSISVGFYGLRQALGNAPQAAQLWQANFGWTGLALMALGLVVMARHRRLLLVLTVTFALTQQIFNLFYAIGDIAVYYVPLYVVGALWAGYGAVGLLRRAWLGVRPRHPADGGATEMRFDAVMLVLLFLLPLLAWSTRGARVDQSDNRAARAMWSEIFAAQPSEDAILVSNDRDEIVPLFYFQYVEGQWPELTGLHPLIAPDARFADIGATLDTALADGGEQPVYLIKEMPGLEIKYQLQSAAPPLVRVLGPRTAAPSIPAGRPLGGLTLLGYDWEPAAEGVRVRLYWRVDQPLEQDYTTTVQLLDADGNKPAQDDSRAGGLYYPSSLWKPGERLVEEHILAWRGELPAGAMLLVGMYAGPDLQQLGPPLRLAIPRSG